MDRDDVMDERGERGGEGGGGFSMVGSGLERVINDYNQLNYLVIRCRDKSAIRDMAVNVCIHVYIYVCVCVCVCVWP